MSKTTASFFVVALMGLVHLGTGSAVQAQDGFALNRYRPAPSSNEGFGLMSPAPPAHLTLDARLVVDFAYGSLAVSTTTPDGRSRDGYLVENTFTTHFAVSLGLADFLGLWVGLPVVWAQSGGDFPSAPTGLSVDGPAAGDMEVGVRAKLVGERERPREGVDFGLGLAASVLIPTGVPQSLTGDDGVGFRVIATAALPTAIITPIVNVGVAYRPEADFLNVRIGTELLFGLGAHLHLDPVRIEAELRGATTLASNAAGDSQAFTGDNVPLEVLLGAHFDLGSGLTAGLAVDAGVTQGIGVPAIRMLGTFGLALPLASEEEGDDEAEAEADSDGDGLPNGVDECPTRAEDADGHADEDGCPEDDADGDGNPDDDDFCPMEPETLNDYLDDDGCPDGASIDGSSIETTEPVLFRANRAGLREEAEASLALVAELLVQNPDIALVQVEGHAAADEGNMNRSLRLSEQRAEAVLDFLVDQGVDVARLTFVGMGSDVPATEGEHDDNRRVTFRILERR